MLQSQFVPSKQTHQFWLNLYIFYSNNLLTVTSKDPHLHRNLWDTPLSLPFYNHSTKVMSLQDADRKWRISALFLNSFISIRRLRLKNTLELYLAFCQNIKCNNSIFKVGFLFSVIRIIQALASAMACTKAGHKVVFMK